MNHKLAKGMKMRKGNRNPKKENTPKGLEILNKEKTGQVKTIVMEHQRYPFPPVQTC